MCDDVMGCVHGNEEPGNCELEIAYSVLWEEVPYKTQFFSLKGGGNDNLLGKSVVLQWERVTDEREPVDGPCI